MKKEKTPHDHGKHFRQICDYLGADIDSPACREVREHLESCPECRAYYDSIRETVYLYRKTEQPCEPPQECREKIMRNVLAEFRKKK
ncbi:MAG: anti-sigma factor family protein [Candidatus Latescibacterota bacterium]